MHKAAIPGLHRSQLKQRPFLIPPVSGLCDCAGGSSLIVGAEVRGAGNSQNLTMPASTQKFASRPEIQGIQVGRQYRIGCML